MRIRHLIPTVGPSASAGLRDAQRITLTSVERALRCADPSLSIEVCSVAFDDEALGLSWLTDVPPLQRSVQDLGSFRVVRRLPLLSDVLERFGDPAEFDLAILTNADIALQPLAYDLIAELRSEGNDAMSITRRTVHPPFGRAPSFPRLSTSIGSPHPGDDCFAFDAEFLPRLIPADVALGVRWVARTLKWQLKLLAERFGQFNDLHATFHIGDDRPWIDDRLADYEAHNQSVAAGLVHQLCNQYGRERVRRLAGTEPFVRALENSEPPSPPPAVSHHNTPSDPPHNAGEPRLVFAANAGRSGSQFLARLLGSASNVDAGHERPPAMIGSWLRRVTYEDPMRSYGDRLVKVDAIRTELDRLRPGLIYADTSHMFVKTFADVVFDSFSHHRITVVALRRNPIDIARSFMELDYLGPIRPQWHDWMPPPTAPFAPFHIEPKLIESQFDLIFGYLVGIDVQTRMLREQTPAVRWIDTSLEAISTVAGATRLFGQLGIARPTTLDRELTKVNARTSVKEQASQAVDRATVSDAWESFLGRHGHHPDVAHFAAQWSETDR